MFLTYLRVNCAGEVTGSLAGTATLASDLGRWLEAVVLIAGGFGGWRVARLRPAAALAQVE